KLKPQGWQRGLLVVRSPASAKRSIASALTTFPARAEGRLTPPMILTLSPGMSSLADRFRSPVGSYTAQSTLAPRLVRLMYWWPPGPGRADTISPSRHPEE